MVVEWAQQDATTRAVALEVLVSGPVARTELARRLGLSQSSLTRLTKPLVESGLLIEAEVADDRGRRVGRPTQPLDVAAASRHFVGIKVTATTAHGVLTDLRCGEVARIDATLASRDIDDVVRAIMDVTAHLTKERPASGVGVSLSGPVVDGRTVIGSPFLGWGDPVDLAGRIEAATGMPAVISNDLVALTHAEQWFGAGRDADNVAVITIGAGVGFGLIAGGQVIQSDDEGVGHIGHAPLEPGGPVCFAGHRGCAAAMLTIDSICAQASVGLGRPVEYDEVLRLARDADPVASSIVSAAGVALGRLIAFAANFTFARTVVLAGEGDELVAVAGDKLWDGLKSHRDPRADLVELVVRPADFVEWARGAAAMAIRAHVLG